MLVKHSVRGGEGGRAGTHGLGGSGGDGGPGGDSYHWSTTEYYTDSNGQRQSRSNSHRNPGGSRGSRGRDGRSGTGHLMQGRDGRRGSLAVLVEGSGGSADRYSSFYDVRLGSFAHDSENQDGVHEPEERIFVKDIVVTNVGGMPTPIRPIQVRLLENEWVAPEEAVLEIPQRLASKEQIILPGPFSFIVKPVQITAPAEAFTQEGNIQLAAMLPAVSRVFDEFGSTFDASFGRFAVRFPLQLSAIEALHSMAAGEQARWAFSLFNVSKRSFGEQGEVPRVVAWTLRLEDSEVSVSQVTFELTSHAGANSTVGGGLECQVERIEPGKPIELEGTVKLSEDARPYEAVRLLLALKLGRPSAPSSPSRIHLREFIIRVAERFRSCEHAEVVLVVHNRTRREELDAWKSVAAQMQVQCATWDVSLEGHLDLDRTVGSRLLSQHFEGKTLIVLNGGFDTPRGERHAYDLAEADALLQHAARGGSTVVLGSKKVRLDWALTPYERIDVDTKTPVASDLDVAHVREHTSQLSPGAGGASFPIIKSQWFGSPSAHELSEAANRVARLVDAAHPNRRHVVTHRHGSGESQSRGLARAYNLGSVRLERTLDVGVRGTVYLALTEDALHDPERVVSNVAPLALTMGLSQSTRLQKLRLLASTQPAPFTALDYLSKREAHVTSWLRHGIAYDLAAEQHEAIARPGFSATTAALPELERLGLFATAAGTPDAVIEDTEDERVAVRRAVAIDSAEGVACVEALAVARAVAWGFVRWWMFFPPLLLLLLLFGKELALHRRVCRQSLAIAKQVFGEQNAGAAIAAVREAAAALRKQTKVGAGSSAHRIFAALSAPFEAAGLCPAAKSTSLVMSDDDHLAFDDVRKRQHKRRRGIVRALNEARNEMLVASQDAGIRVALAPSSSRTGDAFGGEADEGDEDAQPTRLGRA